MNAVSLHVGFLRKTETNEVHPFYASSKEELLQQALESIKEMFSELLEDFDEENSIRFIENESGYDSLLKLYKEHLDENDPENSFEFQTPDEVTLHLNNKLDILDIDIT